MTIPFQREFKVPGTVGQTFLALVKSEADFFVSFHEGSKVCGNSLQIAGDVCVFGPERMGEDNKKERKKGKRRRKEGRKKGQRRRKEVGEEGKPLRGLEGQPEGPPGQFRRLASGSEDPVKGSEGHIRYKGLH